MYHRYGEDTWVTEIMYCTSAVTLWRKDVPALIDGMAEWFVTHPGKGSCFDIALCEAVFRLRKQVCVHAPSLVDHDIAVPSTLGHLCTEKHHTACGTYREDWERGHPRAGQEFL